MADKFKIIAIVGINVHEVDFDANADVQKELNKFRYKPGFVFAALYAGRMIGPLSGYRYSLVKRQARRLKGEQKK